MKDPEFDILFLSLTYSMRLTISKTSIIIAKTRIHLFHVKTISRNAKLFFDIVIKNEDLELALLFNNPIKIQFICIKKNKIKK